MAKREYQEMSTAIIARAHIKSLYFGGDPFAGTQGTEVVATGADINKLASVTAGTAAASKFVCLDSAKALIGMGRLTIGAFASTAAGSGQVLSGTYTASVRVYSDDGGVAMSAAGSVPDLRGFLSRILVTTDNSAQHMRLHAVMGQIKSYDGEWKSEQVSGVHGYLELVRNAGTINFQGYGFTAALMATVENSGAMTVDANHVVAGLACVSKLTSTMTKTGHVPAILIANYDTTNWSDGTARVGWSHGIYFKDIGTGTDGALIKAGTAAATLTMTAAGNAVQFYVTNSAASGTARANYTRLYLSGGAGGEALRAFCTVSSNTPADTCNGAHISLNFGASAGNITGLGTAVRGTLHVPNRSLGGTVAAIQAEIYADGASSDIGGVCALIRGIVDGEATGKATVDGKSFLLDLTATAGAHDSGEMIVASNSGTITGAIKVRINGATKYIPYIDSPVAP